MLWLGMEELEFTSLLVSSASLDIYMQTDERELP